MKTGWLSQIPLSDEPPRADYPPLTEAERQVTDAFAAGLFLFKSSCAWAYWNAKHGDPKAFRKILEILHGKPVTLVKN